MCEKPVGLNSAEMKEIKKEVLLNNTFFMEVLDEIKKAGILN